MEEHQYQATEYSPALSSVTGAFTFGIRHHSFLKQEFIPIGIDGLGSCIEALDWKALCEKLGRIDMQDFFEG